MREPPGTAAARHGLSCAVAMRVCVGGVEWLGVGVECWITVTVTQADVLLLLLLLLLRELVAVWNPSRGSGR
jgi:hypothetical protein